MVRPKTIFGKKYGQTADDGLVSYYLYYHVSLCIAYVTKNNKKNYNMIHHVIIGGFIDVYIVVRFVWF